MRNTLTLLSSILLLIPFCSQAKRTNSTNLILLENKGQIRDQYAKPRNDIQFALRAPGMSVFIGNGAIHYQFSKISDFTPAPGIGSFGKAVDEQHAAPSLCTVSGYRMDVELLGANTRAEMITEGKLAYHENYYLTGCFKDGVQAHAYSKITYRNIYKDIDWVIYLKNDRLEHEFVVRPGGDPSVIRIKYAGQESLKINADGSLTATTPMGSINEHAPECYNSYGVKVASKYIVHNDVLTYDIAAYAGTLVIDPMVQWATYYGQDSGTSPLYSITSDRNGGIYSCGYSYGATLEVIATIGSHQFVFGGSTDAYIVKFDTSGNRCWGTFYGGTGSDWGVGVSCDTSCNVYMGGVTSSVDSISTPGTFQLSYGGGGRDGFLAKFDSAGVRQWGTYAGGSGDNTPTSVSCDSFDHVYLAGDANDINNIATPGAFMPTGSGGFDCCLMQFNTNTGTKNWGTYYGGPGNDWVGVVCSHGIDVYLSGWTPSTTGLTTIGSHQPVYGGGGTDAFLVHFDSSGARIWATYYGGVSSETMGGITCDSAGDVYMLGSSGSDTAIATPGAYQTARAGGMDAFLVKFSAASGARQWGTYFGGPDGENSDKSRLAADDSGHVYITGFTASTIGIATTNAWQKVYGGGLDDGFFAVFTDSGALVYSTYYGGTRSDRGYGCAFDGHAAYICGQTNSSDNIATPGSFLDTGGIGGFYFQGFIAKFIDTTSPPVIDTEVIDTNTYVAISASQDANLSIYPIPNDGSFTLSGIFHTMSGKVQISIADITGRVIARDQAYINNGSINKQIVLGKNVPSGTYFAQVVHQDKAYLIRFIKE